MTKIQKIKFEKVFDTFITDYINYKIAKREVPNMYIAGVDFGK